MACVNWWDRKPMVSLPQNNSASMPPIFPIGLHQAYGHSILKAGGRAEIWKRCPSHSIRDLPKVQDRDPLPGARRARELRKSPWDPMDSLDAQAQPLKARAGAGQGSREPSLQGSEGLCWVHWRSPPKAGSRGTGWRETSQETENQQQDWRKQRSLQTKVVRWALRTEPSVVQETIKLKDLLTLTSVQIPGPAEGTVLSTYSEYLKPEVNWI